LHFIHLFADSFSSFCDTIYTFDNTHHNYKNDDVGEQSGFDDYCGQIDLVFFEEDETVRIFIFFFGFANERDAKKR
jgi:hypothetical protein